MAKQRYSDSINIERELIIHKIYLTKSDIQLLVHCTWKKACEIFDKAQQKCVDENNANLTGRAYYAHVLEVISMSEQDIHRLAKIERNIKKSLPTSNDEATSTS